MKKSNGFTLFELIIVITVMAIIAASLTIFLKPAIDAYFGARRRAELTDMADTALRRMARDIQRAVPNSIFSSGTTCFELVPSVTGGRYRVAADAASGGLALDTATSTSSFDVLSATFLSATVKLPSKGAWIVVDNQNGTDVYTGSNRGQISATAFPPNSEAGVTRITLSPAKQFPPGYDGGRFVAVSDTEQVVVYSCVGNVLYRTVALFGDDLATSCGLTTGAVVATNVAACTFAYDPTVGNTSQSGLVWMRLQLTDPASGEGIVLAHGVHVDNSP